MRFLQPPNWARPKGYSNGVAASGRMVFVSGMIGWDAQGHLATATPAGSGGGGQRSAADVFVAQAGQAMRNIVEVLAEAQAKPADIVRLTWYVVDKREYLAASKALGQVYQTVIGRHYPAMSVVQVAALIENGARVEIEATAVVPD
jgi:enamine deaminase RidA (YjgF/YER057c/UK114 family)